MDPVREFHTGQRRVNGRIKQAGHTEAPEPAHQLLEKPLASEGASTHGHARTAAFGTRPPGSSRPEAVVSSAPWARAGAAADTTGSASSQSARGVTQIKAGGPLPNSGLAAPDHGLSVGLRCHAHDRLEPPGSAEAVGRRTRWRMRQARHHAHGLQAPVAPSRREASEPQRSDPRHRRLRSGRRPVGA